MAKKKITNDENYQNFKKRKILRWLMMLSSLTTIIVAFFTLVYKWNLAFCLIPPVFSIIFRKMYDQTEVELSEYLLNLKEENKSKKRSKSKKKTKKDAK